MPRNNRCCSLRSLQQLCCAAIYCCFCSLRTQLQLLLASLATAVAARFARCNNYAAAQQFLLMQTIMLRSNILLLLLASHATTVAARFARCNDYAGSQQYSNASFCSLRSQLQLLLASLAATLAKATTVVARFARSNILMLLSARFARCNNYAAAQQYIDASARFARNSSCCSLRSLQ